ncbi:hypothetical protein V1478_000332, partial [Vespula squamosa]
RQNKEHRSVACSIINGKHISARGCTNYYPQLSPSENSRGVEESRPTMAVWKVVVVIVEVGRTASHGRGPLNWLVSIVAADIALPPIPPFVSWYRLIGTVQD